MEQSPVCSSRKIKYSSIDRWLGRPGNPKVCLDQLVKPET